jgi:hypothetical protein
MQKIKEHPEFWKHTAVGDILIFSEFPELLKPNLDIKNFYTIIGKTTTGSKLMSFTGIEIAKASYELINEEYWWYYSVPKI